MFRGIAVPPPYDHWPLLARCRYCASAGEHRRSPRAAAETANPIERDIIWVLARNMDFSIDSPRAEICRSRLASTSRPPSRIRVTDAGIAGGYACEGQQTLRSFSFQAADGYNSCVGRLLRQNSIGVSIGNRLKFSHLAAAYGGFPPYRARLYTVDAPQPAPGAQGVRK